MRGACIQCAQLSLTCAETERWMKRRQPQPEARSVALVEKKCSGKIFNIFFFLFDEDFFALFANHLNFSSSYNFLPNKGVLS